MNMIKSKNVQGGRTQKELTVFGEGILDEVGGKRWMKKAEVIFGEITETGWSWAPIYPFITLFRIVFI